jgi:hypothetical protein
MQSEAALSAESLQLLSSTAEHATLRKELQIARSRTNSLDQLDEHANGLSIPQTQPVDTQQVPESGTPQDRDVPNMAQPVVLQVPVSLLFPLFFIICFDCFVVSSDYWVKMNVRSIRPHPKLLRDLD